VGKTDSFQKSFGNMLFVKQNYLIGREQKMEKKKHLFSSPIPIQPGVKPVPLPEIETPGIEVDPIPIQPGVKPVPIPGIETPGIEVDPVPIQPGVKPVPIPGVESPGLEVEPPIPIQPDTPPIPIPDLEVKPIPEDSDKPSIGNLPAKDECAYLADLIGKLIIF
jgi:hypothetical protein